VSTRDECARVAAVLDRLDDGEPGSAEMESAAAHLESCPQCAIDDADRRMLAAVRDLDASRPPDAFFDESAERIMAAVRAEPAGRRETAPPRAPTRRGERGLFAERPARGRARPAARGRRRLVGTALAIAAGVALLVTVSLVGERPGDSGAPVARVEEEAPVVAVASIDRLDALDAADLAAAADAWLVASYDFFELEAADLGPAWDVEDLSDEELEALEAMFGPAPGLG